jgi:hypothetical protein
MVSSRPKDGTGPFLKIFCCSNATQKWYLVQYKQQAYPLLSTHNYTRLVISGNKNNKQLTLLSQRKLAFTAINTLFAL